PQSYTRFPYTTLFRSNERGNSGSRSRNTRTPIETITNASRVPIETRLPASRTVKTAEKQATKTPVTMVVIHGVRNFGSALCWRSDRKSTRLNSSHDQI